MKKLTALLLCAALLLGASACGSTVDPKGSESPAEETTNTAYHDAVQSTLTYVGDYVTLLSAVNTIVSAGGDATAAMQSIRTATGTRLGERVDSLSTFTQGGGYLYLLSGGKLLVYTAAGPATDKVTELTLGFDRSEDAQSKWNYEGKTPGAIYLYGSTLVVVSEYYAYRDFMDDGGKWVYDGSERTCVDIYDVSDPAVPKLTHSMGQDGILTGVLLRENTLYLISKWCPSVVDEKTPATFVPAVYTGDDPTVLPAERVAIMPSPDADVYGVVCAYDLEQGSVSAAETVLGADGDVYLDDGGICLTSQISEELRSQPRIDSVYSVVDCSVRTAAVLCRLDASQGLKIVGAAKLSGAIVGEKLGVSEGRITAVTRIEGYDYSIYTDQGKGFVNSTAQTTVAETARVTVVDSAAMSTLATAELPGAVPAGVWFGGNWAYFSTGDGVGMYAMDLSVPTSPRTVSGLSMNTLAEYLCEWGEGRVLGLSQTEAGAQLLMYDTGDPSAVNVLHTISVDDELTQALEDTDAVFVDSGNFRLAFPTGSCYDVYGFTEAQGFFLLSRIETGADWSGGVRGVNAEGYEYLAGHAGITVIDVNRAIVSARVEF